jgi:hypothetical protein
MLGLLVVELGGATKELTGWGWMTFCGYFLCRGIDGFASQEYKVLASRF